MAYGKAASGLLPFKKRLQFLYKSRAERASRTYIVPTRFGLAFGTMATVLFLMAMGYSNNLIYIYAFFLISVAFSSMYVTNENIRRLNLGPLSTGPLYANEPSSLLVTLSNRSAQESLQLKLYSEPEKQNQVEELAVAGKKTEIIQLPWRPLQRGYQTTPQVTLESSFPFGILVAWKTFSSAKKVLVFPERKGKASFPEEAQPELVGASLGLFRDHRVYQTSDSPRHIDWRATARSQNLLIKNYEGGEKVTLNFYWEQVAHVESFEAKLSQLSLWLSRAEAKGLSYCLQLKAFTSGVGDGPEHLQACLAKLAVLQEKELL